MNRDTALFLLEAIVIIVIALWGLQRHMARKSTPPARGGAQVAKPEAPRRPALPPDRAPSAPRTAPPAGKEEVRNIKPEEALGRLRSDAKIILLDVRQPDEYAERRIPGSVLLPLTDEDEFIAGAARVIPGLDSPVFVYCHSGRRSLRAARFLVRHGYSQVYNLGGIVDWPYETLSGARTEGETLLKK